MEPRTRRQAGLSGIQVTTNIPSGIFEIYIYIYTYTEYNTYIYTNFYIYI